MSDVTVRGDLVGEGIVTRRVRGSVGSVLERLLDLLRRHAVTVFAVIDHSGEAERVGQHLRDTKLVIFGNPTVGTPLMESVPLAALDLPLKLLIWADGTDSLVSYNAPSHLARRYQLSEAQAKVLSAVDGLADSLSAPSPT
jgi:uncharacterized protein (DUF302 family)